MLYNLELLISLNKLQINNSLIWRHHERF
jgi:hypothetical protein